MNQETALKKGYERTGIYARSADKVRPLLEEIRKQGYKALLVTVPDSPYSRGHVGTGYGVVVERRYNLDQAAKSHLESLAAYAGRCEAVRAHHQAQIDKEVADLTRNKQEAEKWLVENGYSTLPTTTDATLK